MEHTRALEQAAEKIIVRDERETEWIPLDRFTQRAEHVGGMVVCSSQIRKLLKTLKRVSPYRQTVLIEGESGTGKELVARALHGFSPNPNAPFVTFNCSNLVDSLAEAQLFGHVKGAFTDAREDSLGYFRSANGGTLFLDEIGELPMRLQPKLLRAVENHEVQPVGSSQCYKVEIRLVAATNRDLRAMIKKGEFRDDLYYRLNSAALVIPPLRERQVAIPSFIAHFVARFNEMFDKHVNYISHEALSALCAYPWPGNVRELAHVIETAVLMTDHDRIAITDLPAQILSAPAFPERITEALTPVDDPAANQAVAAPQRAPSGDFNPAEEEPLLLDEVIKRTLLQSLQYTRGNRRRAAVLLGVSRSTLYRMLERYGLDSAGRTREPRIEAVHPERDVLDGAEPRSAFAGK